MRKGIVVVVACLGLVAWVFSGGPVSKAIGSDVHASTDAPVVHRANDPCVEYGSLSPQCFHSQGIKCADGEVFRDRVLAGVWERSVQLEEWSRLSEQEREKKINPANKEILCSLSGPICRSKTSSEGIKEDDCLVESYKYGIYNDYLPRIRQARKETRPEDIFKSLDEGSRVLKMLCNQCESLQPWEQVAKNDLGSVGPIDDMAAMLNESSMQPGLIQAPQMRSSSIQEKDVYERRFVHERNKSAFRPCLHLEEMKTKAQNSSY